ncbi:protein Son [Anastrepha ludens]|uniref:protein Son n=1 Tax=Anastrepha ludens TaxID=28586 RepID=UPI0023AEED3F|nr:protein Son [Anastrepha ludens]
MPEEQKDSDTRVPSTVQQVKVKQEKFDPEIEAKINAISIANVVVKSEFDKERKNSQLDIEYEFEKNEKSENESEYGDGNDGKSVDDNGDENDNKYGCNDGDSNMTGASLDEDKKSIAPVKSSNEILAELFKVFNAAPPEELLDDESLLKKNHKHKKDKKEKKKKVKRVKGVLEDERNDSESNESIVPADGKEKKYKHKHKKKKKHKHKDEKDKERDKNKDKGKKDKDKSKDRLKSKEKSVEKYKVNSRKSTPPRSAKTELEVDRRNNKSRKRHIDSDSYTDPVSVKKSRSADGPNPFRSYPRDCRHENDKHNERDRPNDKHRDKDLEKDKDKEKVKDRKHNSFYNGCPEYESSKKAVKIKEEPKDITHKRGNYDGHISEISLSDDEEDYLKESHVSTESKNHHINERPHNSFYAGLKRSRSRDQDRDRNRDRERERERNYRGDGRSHIKRPSRSRGRSRSRSRDLGIDKKRLLEIARKNAISMFKRGNLPGCDGMSQEVKDKVLLKMRYGGKTVQDLTDFCKKISNGENLSDLSSDEDSDVDKSGNTKAFHHPFQLKEREPIVMHIRNAATLPVRPTSTDQVKAITMQFPVSSGQQHRMTEGWVPVVPKDNLPPLPALPTAAQATTIFKPGVVKNVFEKSIPEEQQKPAFKQVQPASTSGSAETNGALPNENGEAAVAPTMLPTTSPITLPTTLPTPVLLPPPAAKPNIDTSIASKPFFSVPQQSVAVGGPQPMVSYSPTMAALLPPLTVPPPTMQQAFVPDVPVPSSTDAMGVVNSVFPNQYGPQMDVSSIISKRLLAMRRLQENPMDPEAIKMMYNSQKDMTSWVSSKHLPGQFTGSTGANVLSMRELSSGPQAWARRDQLITSRPVSGGMGMQLLQKMGWKPGEGLGRDKTGSLQPLLLDVKLDKHGLVAREDNTAYKQKLCKKQRPQNDVQQQQALLEKHPVCLLNELTSKRKWTPPLYTLVNEAGPSHSRMFLFSVSINGHTYTPSQGSNTKKEAKLISARHCLQQMGILPM